MTTSPMDYVMFYADRGWKVFPIKPHDKRPLFPAAHEPGNPCKGECGELGHGFHDATFDVFTLGEWWSKYPNANIGLATGSGSGFMVLDVDPVHDGEKTFQEHVSRYGQMPVTPVSKTGSGGHHYLFKMPDLDVRNSAGKLGNGLDTRGNGGYIVAPFSIHPNGNPYQWETKPSNTALADPPDWILKKLFEKKEQQVQQGPLTNDALIAGQRNNTLTSLAGSMQRRGMSQDAIFVALNAENLNRCVPPLSESEVKSIVLSVSRYTPQAAPNYQSRDRVTAEWAFCKTIYENPDYYVDFQNVKPESFADAKLRDYWSDVVTGMGVAQAATNAGILTEIEHYSDWALPRVDDYAKNILHFDRMAKISAYGWRLQKAAEEGDYTKIDRTVNELNSIPPQTGHIVESVSDVADEVEKFIQERAKNPVDVWGIPYAWNKISTHTGGKQIGELTLLAGEPKIGKSYWKLQDALQTAIKETPVFYWCGEMPKVQLMRRFYSLLGVNSRNMKSGTMTEEDWDMLRDAKALILNSPLYIDDKLLNMYEIRPMLARMKSEYGIQEFIIDYASKVVCPGKDEIEQSSNLSKELKQICIDLELAGTMIASVNKQGMDNKSVLSKSNVRGSGQQIHDADLIMQITTFPEKYGMEYGIAPVDYTRCIALNISAGRELEEHLEGGFIPYMRETNKTSFKELIKK